MTPYIVVFMISIGLFALSDRVKYTQRKPIVFISVMALCLLAGMRAVGVGTDTRVYLMPVYEAAKRSHSIGEYLNSSFHAFTWTTDYVKDSFIKNGGYVASCMLNKGEFVFELTNSTQRAEQFVGSKYVKSNPKTIYIDIERKLQEGKKVLFVGLPCQVAALKNFSRNQDNLYTVDLICHGSPSPELLKMYLKEKSVDIEELEGLNFREKTSFGLRSVGKSNGFPRIVDMYTYAFLKSIDYTENCYSCRYASQSRVSDISLGDSWGSELSEEEKKKGISLVLCQTKKGEELLKKSNVELFDADITRAIQLNHQLEYPSRIPSSRMFFFENLEKGFDFAMKKILPKEYLKNEIKIILSKVGIRR